MQCHFHPQKVKNVLNTYHCGLQANQDHHSNAVSFQCQMQSNISSPFLCTYIHMYFRKSVRISKIHLQCSSSVWENINIKFKSKYPVPTIKLAQKNVLKSVESTWVLLSRINQTIRVNWTSNLGQFYKKSKSHVLTNNSINIKLY